VKSPIVKALLVLSLSHVRSAIASTELPLSFESIDADAGCWCLSVLLSGVV